MARCRSIQKDLIAWVDGELSPRRSARVRGHVARCAQCTSDADGVRAAVGTQRRVLAQLAAVQVDHALLHARLRRAIVGASRTEEQPGGERWWVRRQWLTSPLVISGIVATLMIVLVVTLVGGPQAVLIPLGFEAPPVAVARQPDLFMDYPIIQHLDALEHFDTVEAVHLDDKHHEAQRG